MDRYIWRAFDLNYRSWNNLSLISFLNKLICLVHIGFAKLQITHRITAWSSVSTVDLKHPLLLIAHIKMDTGPGFGACGIRTAVKDHLNCSAAEMVCGPSPLPLKLQGQFLFPSNDFFGQTLFSQRPNYEINVRAIKT
ncbi:hypothetical protein ACTXT7_009989 [Hymenolepis weldensis]